MTLATWLTNGIPDERRQKEAQLALAAPWCWPRAEALRRAAGDLACAPPQSAAPGETLLVSVSGERAALWRGAPDSVHPITAAQRIFRRGALETGRLAWRLVARDMPALRDIERLRPEAPWIAHLIAKLGNGKAPSELDGRSFGLAMALGAASFMLDEPVPTHLAALGTLDITGAVGPVDSLPLKLNILDGYALGVDTVLVSTSQAAEAQSHIDRLDRDLRVLAVDHLRDAITNTWPDLVTTHLRWPDDASVHRALDALTRQTLYEDAMLLGWQAIATTAAALARELHTDPPRAARARFIETVAKRHRGITAPLPWPTDDTLLREPRPLRLRLIAHIVQSAADHFADSRPDDIARALTHVAPAGERHAEDLAVLGAIVRAHASLHQITEAIDLAHHLIQSWLSLLAPAGASRTLCELLRLLGVDRRTDDLDAARRRYLPTIRRHPSLSPVDHAFITLAESRALMQTSRWAEGAALLTANLTTNLTANLTTNLTANLTTNHTTDLHAWQTADLAADLTARSTTDRAADLHTWQTPSQEPGAVRLATDRAADLHTWQTAPDHLRWARLRWLARAAAALGSPAEAQAHRAALEAELAPRHPRHPHADPNLHLARLDHALESGGDPTPHLHALLAGHEAREITAIIAGRPLTTLTARDVADRYRY